MGLLPNLSVVMALWDLQQPTNSINLKQKNVLRLSPNTPVKITCIKELLENIQCRKIDSQVSEVSHSQMNTTSLQRLPIPRKKSRCNLDAMR